MTSGAVRSPIPVVHPHRILRVLLWTGQLLLSALFLLAGALKVFTPLTDLMQQVPWTRDVPALFVRFVGLCEMAGAVGLVLPALFRVWPALTAWSASLLALLMMCAVAFHAVRGESANIPIPAILGIAAALVAWGRFRLAPILRRRAPPLLARRL